MLAFFSVLMMLIVAYAHWREGLFTAFCYCVNVILAGLITFGRGAIHCWLTFVVALAVFGASLRTSINPALLILGGAVVGVVALR